MKSYSKWKDSEVKKLFNCIEKIKEKNGSLLDGFKDFAKKTKRKTNSIRNYYYLEVEDLKTDPERVKKMGIDLAIHNVQNPDRFSKEETEKLVTKILQLKCLGVSVRKACLQLANNSPENMLRYQNKFRSVVVKDKPLYNKCLANLKKIGLSENKKLEKNENIIYMKKVEDKKITDDDINSLFLGLVKLIKRNAVESIEKNLIDEAEFANNGLRENFIKLAKLEKDIEDKERQLDKEQEKNKMVMEENFKLKTQLASLISKKIPNNHKNKSVFKYLNDLKSQGKEIRTKI